LFTYYYIIYDIEEVQDTQINCNKFHPIGCVEDRGRQAVKRRDSYHMNNVFGFLWTSLSIFGVAQGYKGVLTAILSYIHCEI